MPGGAEPTRPGADAPDGLPAFVVERFDWGAPDRLELAGTFTGVAAESVAEPVLAVHGGDGIHRLPAVGQDGNDGAPDAEGRWAAAFAWLEPPVAFHTAELELAGGLTVVLPEPGATVDGAAIPVRPAGAVNGAAATSDDVEQALHRLSQDAQQLERALAAAAGERARNAERAEAEAAALRERVAELEQAAGDLAEARAERDEARRGLEEARREIEALQRALADARSGAQELVERMSRIADPPAEGR
jgi:hypothetical protein